jgi:hypothetical protein
MMSACNQQKTGKSRRAKPDSSVSTPKKKAGDKKKTDINKPVAALTLNTDDEVTDNDFTVEVFPTRKQDVFSIKITYGGNTAGDEVTMLPESYYKKIALRKGKNDNECLMGFIDKKDNFNEMKSITASGTQIGIKTLKAYYLSTK